MDRSFNRGLVALFPLSHASRAAGQQEFLFAYKNFRNRIKKFEACRLQCKKKDQDIKISQEYEQIVAE